MADAELCTRASFVGKWKGGVAKKYDFCLSRRSEAHGAGSVMSTTSTQRFASDPEHQHWSLARAAVVGLSRTR